MSRKEKIIANRDTAQGNYKSALRDTAKSEALLRLYEACLDGVTNRITEISAKGVYLQDYTNAYLPALEELTERAIAAKISLMENKEKLKETYEISMQADKAYFDMLEESGKGATLC